MNYLIFRTDRVGDLILSSILLKSIKRSDSNNKIYVICSKANFDLAKNLSFIDDAFILKKGFFNKLKLIIKIYSLKIENTLILDGKDRSILFSMLIYAKKKIYVLNKKKFAFLFVCKKNNLIYDNELIDFKINIIKKTLDKLHLNFSLKDLNVLGDQHFFRNKQNNKLNFLNKNNYYLLHYDEKWIKNLYISSYKNIELDVEDLNSFLNSIMNISKVNLVLTSGKESSKPLDQLKKTMNVLSDNIYFKKNNNNFLYYIEQPNFNELIEVIYKSILCITCHGSPTHISSSFNKKTIDIVDGSKILQYRAYTKHLQNYNEVIRASVKETTVKILSLL
jgi:ADP-heptose:LPS heptosyltransferase